MFVIWRGYGLLALAVWVPVLASCAGLGSVEPRWLLPFALTGAILAGGAACVYYGTLWNRAGGGHTLYFVPLQAWGWAYIALVVLYGGFGAVTAVVYRLDRPGVATEVLAGAAHAAAACVVGWLLILALRSRPVREAITLRESADPGRGSPDPWD